MKKRRKVILMIIIITSTCFLCFLYFIPKKDNDSLQEEILFLRRIKEKNKKEKQTNQYEIEIGMGKIEIKSIILTDTIEEKWKQSKKIEPGVKGKFEIILKSTQDSYYELKFQSKNDKPKNLVFQLEGKKAGDQLETLKWQGNLKKEEKKKILVQWEWNYESKGDPLQDTKDAKKIQKYEFEIVAKGEKKESR